MPTFNQLVRKGRETSVKKSTAPALQRGFNSLRKRSIAVSGEVPHFLAAFGLLAPYLERACLRFATPAVSSVPRMM